MPYGQDFLDTLNDMLNDGGQTSNNIQAKCTKCHGTMGTKFIAPQGMSSMNKYGAADAVVDESFSKTCDACQKAKLVDWDGQQYTSARIWD